MLRRLSVAAALCALVAVAPAHALGLGDIKVNSGLNQRFSAVIPFTSLTPDEAANVRARLAENNDFARAGLDRSAYLSTIRVEAITEGANPRLELRSGEIAREPLLTLLVEVRKPGGTRMLREYTVLLDPAVTSASAAPSSRAQPLPGASDSEFFQTPEEASGRGSKPRRAAGGGSSSPSSSASGSGGSIGADGLYGPVRPGETLWMIAQAVKPAGVGLDQAMLALFEANPGAFTGGDIDYLRKGSKLRIPDTEAMQAMSNAAARARVLELSAQMDGAPSTPPAPGGSTLSTDSSFPAPTPPPTSKPYDPQVTAVPPPSTTTTPSDATTPGSSAAPGSAILTPPVNPTTGETPSATGTTPPTGDATATTGTTPDATATPPAATTGDAAAPPAGDAAAVTPPAPAEPEESLGSWILKLLPFLILLILLIIGFIAYRAARERKAQREYEQAAREGSGLPPPRMGATGAFAAKATNSARAELEAIDRAIDDDATRIAPSDDDPDRTRMVTTSKIPVYTGPSAADRKLSEDELAVTSQFQANTKEIKLGDNDPISEADFHLAYGLYDEAALLLQQASARAPRRTDLRLKLAETYFAAGKAPEFEQTAGTLKGEVSADEWNKIAIMGRQLAPASALFAGAETSSDTVLDLTFDDDATQIAPVKVDEGLEFNLEELELPSKTEQLAAQANQSLEFDLGEFDLGGADKPKAKTPSPAAEAELELRDFDLGGTDLAGPGKSKLDVSLDEIDPMVIDDPLGDEGLSAGNDAATKLDLARAYVEMGDAEMARSLLDEVTQSGTDEQKREAGELRERLIG